MANQTIQFDKEGRFVFHASVGEQITFTRDEGATHPHVIVTHDTEPPSNLFGPGIDGESKYAFGAALTVKQDAHGKGRFTIQVPKSPTEEPPSIGSVEVP